MGEIDGFGLCRRVRADATLERIPVVLVSSHYGHDDLSVAKSVGASTLVERTPTFAAELEAVRACLVARGPRRHSQASAQHYEEHLRANANQLTRLSARAKRADERYRTLLDEAYDAIAILTPEGVILDANRRWQDILGVEPSALIGLHVRDLAAPGKEAENAERFRDAVAEGSRSEVVALRRRTDDAVVYMELSSRVVELDGGVEVLTIGRDVTAQVESTRRLVETEAMYRSLVERIPDVVWRLRADGTFAFISPNLRDITGLDPSQLYRGGIAVVISRVHADDRDRVTAALEASLSGSACEVDCRFLTASGRTIWLHSRVNVVRDAHGVMLEGLTTDVTSRRVLEQSLAQAQKMEAIGQLTGGIAHDFNNLLSVIMANAGFLLEQLAPNDPRRTDAEEIESAAGRASALTRQLLSFSRREPVAADGDRGRPDGRRAPEDAAAADRRGHHHDRSRRGRGRHRPW